MPSDILLEWQRDARGYRIEHPPATPRNELLGDVPYVPTSVLLPEGFLARRPTHGVLTARIMRVGGSLVPCAWPLSLDAAVQAFLNMPATPKNVLEFVNSFGALTNSGNVMGIGEPVAEAIELHAGMTSIVDAAATLNKTEKRKALAQFLGADGVRLSGVDVQLIFDAQTQALRTLQVARNLATALWLRLLIMLMGNVALRRCQHCGELFGAGPDTGRDAKARFCSDEHRVRYNSLRRTRRVA
jgi:hypothetical protein